MNVSEAIEMLNMLKRAVKEDSDEDKALDIAIGMLAQQEQSYRECVWILCSEKCLLNMTLNILNP